MRQLETKNWIRCWLLWLKQKKSGEKNVVVFTTERKHYKKEMASELGFSAGDLKPKFYEAYKYFLCKHDATTRLLNPEKLAVEWIVKLK